MVHQPSPDFRLAKCENAFLCPLGLPTFVLTSSPFRQVGNAGMRAHLKAAHLTLFEETEASVEAFNTPIVLEGVDKKDETVRGTKPLFKLRSKGSREEWRNLVIYI